MESIWKKQVEIPRRESLNGTVKTKVAVIGAGMAGILTAYLLKSQGMDVVVLEADRIGSGQTRNTTAKITSQHNLIYASLIDKFGEEKARQYAHANEQAIERYQEIILKEQIDCQFQRCPSYLYTIAPSRTKDLENEVLAAKLLGIQAEYIEETDLPLPVAGAVKFQKQAQFHPLEFIKSLTENLTIYEHSRVIQVEGQGACTKEGKVEAEHIVFAVHYPWQVVPGYYFLRMHQERSYVIALELPGDQKKWEGMYLGIEKEGYSFRTCQSKGKTVLLMGGGSHRTGENISGGKYDNLRKHAREWFPGCSEIAHWSAQDCMPMDHIPYIGNFSSEEPNWYVATGFGKWGMTSSMVSATIISDMILGRKNEDREVFAPQRFPVAALSKNFAENVVHAVKGLSKQALSAEEFPGKCPHMGCKLEKNEDEATWECPCHGSCFREDGRLLHGPAQYDLEKPNRGSD